MFVIRGLIKQFKRSPKFLIQFLLLKYFILPLRTREELELNQNELFKKVLGLSSFTIIIIDACRYDIFKEIYQEYLQGELLKVKSLGTDTGSFLKVLINMTDFKDIRVFSSTPQMSKSSIHKNWLTNPFYPPRLEIIDLWKTNWNNEFDMVLPEEVNKVIIDYGLSDRNIIWYMPPHFPWIDDISFSKNIINEAIIKNKPISEILEEKNKRGIITTQRIKQLYINNLQLSLTHITNLIKKIEPITDTIILTSDHGELLGEHNLFFHYTYLDVPELYTVPWLIIK